MKFTFWILQICFWGLLLSCTDTVDPLPVTDQKALPSTPSKYEVKMTPEEIKKKLTPLQYTVTQRDGTERPFKNEYWDNKEPGIYVDVVSGEPLFSSLDKYKSGTGWPSFDKPLTAANIQYKKDRKLFRERTEVRSKHANSHLGHVFNDGPASTGKRYCINSAALRFIPVKDLAKEGYGEYSHLFSRTPANAKTAPQKGKATKAVFAGGCFWCVESDFEKVKGVSEVHSGYIGGKKENPTYKEVSGGGTGHLEAVEVHYDPKVVSYKELLDVFWKHVDPTDAGGQFVDRGQQYSSAIFYLNEEQKKLAEQSKAELGKNGPFDKPIVTPIIAAPTFYPAETYHQNYYKKNPIRYKFYRAGSGRDRFLRKTWGKLKKFRSKKQ